MATATEIELRELLSDCCRILFHLGLTDYMGHPSVRIPGTDHVLIKPRHSLRIRAMGRVKPEDMVIIDLDGKMVEGNDGPPSERFIHTCIYRARPDVQAIVHTHQPWATLMGVVAEPILPILHVESPLVERPVPVWPCAQLVTDDDLGKQLATALGDHQVCLLQGHGMVSAAETVQEATVAAIHLERLADANYKVLAINKSPRVIPPEEIKALKARGVGTDVRWAYYAELAGVDQD
ncbi:MAG TPA: class II aldolase/adducin family protein [Chloroflexota bacterium]